jgi:uncharacterized protein (TIGR02246 family)
MNTNTELANGSKEAFQKLFDHIADCWNAGDRMPYVNVCKEDCVYMVPNGETIIGKKGIKDFVFAFPDVHTWYTIVEVFGKPELTFVRGKYVIKFPDGSPMDHGKFICIYALTEEGEWKQSHTIWNSDLPPQV